MPSLSLGRLLQPPLSCAEYLPVVSPSLHSHVVFFLLLAPSDALLLLALSDALLPFALSNTLLLQLLPYFVQ